MKTKVEGISILIAMGTSLLILSLAFATLTSIGRSIDQASNIQRSTQLFFASESGAEAAFFHHNARGAGLAFTGTDPSQTIEHSNTNATTQWSLEGRTTLRDSATLQNATIIDILKEGQTFKIPLQWDPAANPGERVPTTVAQYDTPNNGPHNLQVRFFPTANDLSTEIGSSAIDQPSFDFNNPDNEILIDWSITRKNSGQGVQTFIPSNNQDCAGFSAGNSAGYICENDLTSSGVMLRTDFSAPGKVLPGSRDSTLSEFWRCVADVSGTVTGFESCSDYQLTIRPLLKFNSSTGDKIPGIPFELKLDTTIGTPPKHFPLNHYKVISDVTLENFSQRIEIEVPERTSIGAFDYVIFD